MLQHTFGHTVKCELMISSFEYCIAYLLCDGNEGVNSFDIVALNALVLDYLKTVLYDKEMDALVGS